MLAKDIKIRTILRQRAFLKEQLSHLGDSENQDGDPAYCYNGYVYSENIRYFENEEGFTVNRVKSDMLTAMLKGRPLYVFTPKDNILLGEEEMKEAEQLLEQWQEEHNQRKQEIHAAAEAAADDFLERIFGVSRPYADGPDSSDEDDHEEE